MNKKGKVMVCSTKENSEQNCRVAKTFDPCATPADCCFEDVFDTVEICKNCNKHK